MITNVIIATAMPLVLALQMDRIPQGQGHGQSQEQPQQQQNQPEWTSHVDDTTGNTFYYNTRTKVIYLQRLHILHGNLNSQVFTIVRLFNVMFVATFCFQVSQWEKPPGFDEGQQQQPGQQGPWNNQHQQQQGASQPKKWETICWIDINGVQQCAWKNTETGVAFKFFLNQIIKFRNS